MMAAENFTPGVPLWWGMALIIGRTERVGVGAARPACQRNVTGALTAMKVAANAAKYLGERVMVNLLTSGKRRVGRPLLRADHPTAKGCATREWNRMTKVVSPAPGNGSQAVTYSCR